LPLKLPSILNLNFPSRRRARNPFDDFRGFLKDILLLLLLFNNYNGKNGDLNHKYLY